MTSNRLQPGVISEPWDKGAAIPLHCRQRKDTVAGGILRTHAIAEGLVCVLGYLEHCPSFRLVQAKGRPDFVWPRPPALDYLDPALGLIHIRVPTLFPWPIKIAVNGHD